ncbi:MAG: FkbM family methyltransferase [Oscillospiraceae bacterium]|nr:FkbM family methyltransferase [Oscillospiraceae bacterium]
MIKIKKLNIKQEILLYCILILLIASLVIFARFFSFRTLKFESFKSSPNTPLMKSNFKLDHKREEMLKNGGFLLVDNNVVCAGKTKIRLFDNSNIGVFEKIFVNSNYEIELPKNKKFAFFDIGCNVGMASLFASQKSEISKIYAFEPFAFSVKRAAENFNLNPDLSSKIKLFNFGLSDQDKDVVCSFPVGFSASASTHFSLDGGKKEKVSLKKASTFLKEIINQECKNEKIILKIDCEGAEYEILPDLDKAGILKKVDLLFLEWHLEGSTIIRDILSKNDFIFIEKVRGSTEKYGEITAVRCKK